MTILRVEDVVSGYGSMEVLHGLSLDVEEGQIVSLLGPNGSGKTTLLRTVFGILSPWKGKIYFKGEDISGIPPERGPDETVLPIRCPGGVITGKRSSSSPSASIRPRFQHAARGR